MEKAGGGRFRHAWPSRPARHRFMPENHLRPGGKGPPYMLGGQWTPSPRQTGVRCPSRPSSWRRDPSIPSLVVGTECGEKAAQRCASCGAARQMIRRTRINMLLTAAYAYVVEAQARGATRGNRHVAVNAVMPFAARVHVVACTCRLRPAWWRGGMGRRGSACSREGLPHGAGLGGRPPGPPTWQRLLGRFEKCGCRSRP